MEKQLDLVNKAIDYAISIEEMANVKNFDIKTERGKAKYNLAKTKALKAWINYDGDNPYILAIRRKYTGKISSGGRGGVTVDFGQDDIPQGLHIGSLKDWTWGRQNFKVNKSGTHISSGHVRGMPTAKGALTELKENQKWILKSLSVPKLTGKDLKNVPWAVLHSNDPNLEKYFGRWDLSPKTGGGVANPLQIGGRSWLRNQEGPDNPFTSERWVDDYYDAKEGTTVTKRGKLLGILPYTRTKKGPQTLNHPEYGVKTDHFGDTTYSGSQESKDKGSVLKTRSLNSSSSSSLSISGDTVYGGGGWFGSGTDIRTSTGGSTALTIHKGNDYYVGGRTIKAGDQLGVLTRRQRALYDKDNPHYMN